MLISPELASAINAQIGHEFGASMQYLSIAGEKNLLMVEAYLVHVEKS